jgi:hypothetical protein
MKRGEKGDRGISDKLSLEANCQESLRSWLKEKWVVRMPVFRKRGNNQLDIRFADGFNNTKILIFGSRKIFNGIDS